MSTPHPDQEALIDTVTVQFQIKKREYPDVAPGLGQIWEFRVAGAVTMIGTEQSADGVVRPVVRVTAYDVQPVGPPRSPERPQRELPFDGDGDGAGNLRTVQGGDK